MRVEGKVILEERYLHLDLDCKCGVGIPRWDPAYENVKNKPKDCTVCIELAERGWRDTMFGFEEDQDYVILAETGLFLGQSFVLDLNVHWSSDYYGESDRDVDWAITYRGPVRPEMVTRTCRFIELSCAEHMAELDAKHARAVRDDIIKWRWKSPGRIKPPITEKQAEKKRRDREWSRNNGW